MSYYILCGIKTKEKYVFRIYDHDFYQGPYQHYAYWFVTVQM